MRARTVPDLIFQSNVKISTKIIFLICLRLSATIIHPDTHLKAKGDISGVLAYLRVCVFAYMLVCVLVCRCVGVLACLRVGLFILFACRFHVASRLGALVCHLNGCFSA